MDLGADLVGDDTKDALAVFRRQSLPGSLRPPAKRSIHSRPSGLSMISTMAGSSSQASIACPIAVRSIPMPREAASELGETVPTAVPEICDRLVRSNSGDN